jgi:mannose-6-phosphate isomerase-like protein (cupin superfamily)
MSDERRTLKMSDNAFDMTNVPQVSVFRPKDMGKRVWGQELLVGLMPGAAMKLIQMNAGFCGRFQMHWKREEHGYVLEGSLIVRVGLQDGSIKTMVLGPGDAYHFPAGLPHQEEAVTDVKVMELSPDLGNDRKGLEAEYGLPEPVAGALPDSTPDEVYTLEPWWKPGVIPDGILVEDR